MTKEKLIPTFQNSFYGKANVLLSATGRKYLMSYKTIVLSVTPDGTMTRHWNDWSATTGKHIKEFCGLNKKSFLALPFERIRGNFEYVPKQQ